MRVGKAVDILVLFEHPEWQKTLFSALERRGLTWAAFNLESAAFDPASLPEARLVFSQASPSAATRGHRHAVPMALALLRSFDAAGVPVVNGHRAFALELSKSAQVALCQRLGVAAPRTLAFADVDALLSRLDPAFPFPALLKPDLGGSGARIREVANREELAAAAKDPALRDPDPILLLQEKLQYDPDHGIVRLELLGGELLYAMRVVAHGGFNLCPSEVCHPTGDEAGACAVPAEPVRPPSFFPYPEVPRLAVEQALRIAEAGGLDVAGIEYASVNGEPVFYDINANSNLRPAVAAHFGFDPFERVVDHLVGRLSKT